jgi:hypothetical protein
MKYRELSSSLGDAGFRRGYPDIDLLSDEAQAGREGLKLRSVMNLQQKHLH